MRRRIVRMLVFPLLAAACASGGGRSSPSPSTSAPPWDGGLMSILNRPWSTAQGDSLAAYELRNRIVDDTLSALAEDTAGIPIVRANALIHLSERSARHFFTIAGETLAARDELVRLATATALRHFIDVRPEETRRLLERALRDPSPAVQTKALESIGLDDIAALRAYVATRPMPELRRIAVDLIAAAEERGVPLVAESSTGVLTRLSASGHRLTYRPSGQHTGDVTSGTLELTPADRATVVVARDVEVVRDVVPAFFSSDGARLVYEAGRQVFVRDVRTGETRRIGSGIAPRVLPFSDAFVFLRERTADRNDSVRKVELTYDVVRARFDPVAAADGGTTIGKLIATSQPAVHGNASPVRWMRVTETDGRFALAGEGIDAFALPDPFAAGGNGAS